MKNTIKFKWKVGDYIVNYHNWKSVIKQRLTDEHGRPCYLVDSTGEECFDKEVDEANWIIPETEIMCLDKDYEGQDCENIVEVNDEDRNEIARLIKEGMTSGRLDSEDEKGNGIYITWELKTLKWQDL